MTVEIILSTVLAVSTVIYTGISLLLWKESNVTRKQKLNPQVIAFLKSAENHIVLELHIKNIGEGLAKNLKVKVLQDFKRMDQEDLLLSDLEIMKKGFNIFPPQYELKYYIGTMTDLYEKNKDGFIKLEFEYKSTDNRKFTDVFELPLVQIFGQNYSNPPETFIGQIPFYLKEINQTLKKLEKKNNQ